MEGLIEKTICLKCGIVFPKASECPRCGGKKDLDIYLEARE
jgi:ribosomal protein L40E